MAFVGRNASLLDAVSYAFDIEPWRVAAPDWFKDAKYIFLAMSRETNPRPAFRALLEEKFALITRIEIRPVQAWVLRRSRIGKELIAADVSDLTSRLRARASAGSSLATVEGAWSFQELARFLQVALKAPVLDETGTGGNYQLSAQLTLNDPQSMVRSFRDELGIELSQEYRDMEVLTVISAVWPDAPAIPRYACEPEPAVRAAIAALPSMDDHTLSFERRMSPRKQLMETYASNIFAAMAVQDALQGRSHLAREWDWALSIYQTLEDPLLSHFLRARLLAEIQPAQSEKSFKEIAGRAPDFPWVHLALAQLAVGSAEIEEPLRKLRKLCPDSLAGSSLYDHIRDPVLLDEALQLFGRALSGYKSDQALALYPDFWRLRQKAWQGSPEGLKNLMKLDLTRLRLSDRTSSSTWIDTLSHGYRLIQDEASLHSLHERVLLKHPSSLAAWKIVRERWQSPKNPDELAAAIANWQARWPHLPQIVFEKWRAVSAAPDVGEEQIQEAAAAFLAVSKLYPDLLLEAPAPILVAEVFKARKLNSERIGGLINDGLQQAEEEERYRLGSEVVNIDIAAHQRLAALRARANRIHAVP
jgi:uncharacterized protein (TIGR03435 family)